MTTKVIFLDVDGPLIPGRMYLTPERTFREDDAGKMLGYRFDPVAVGMLKKLIAKTDARIVFNTAHNSRDTAILDDARAAGLDELHIHPQTEFPGNSNVAHYQMFGERISRMSAINKWLNQHPEVTHWVAIDDERINHPNAVLVDFDDGLTVEIWNQALARLDGVMAEKFADDEITDEIEIQNPIAKKTLEEQTGADSTEGAG